MYKMEKIIAVTNRNLCSGDFLAQIKRLCEAKVKAIILREKDLSEDEYEALAEKVMGICQEYPDTDCILHTYIDVAHRLKSDKIHLSLSSALTEEKKKLEQFSMIGISTHSVEQAKKAMQAGATYITAGHVFVTDCKKGLPPRGIDFLKEICSSVDLPVYAIGGIDEGNFQQILDAGAKGGCMMSGMMKY